MRVFLLSLLEVEAEVSPLFSFPFQLSIPEKGERIGSIISNIKMLATNFGNGLCIDLLISTRSR
jgi:hypothetical protein